MGEEKEKKKMMAVDYVVAAILVSLVAMIIGGALFGIIYAFRWGLNATAPITVHDVDEGIRCAISSGGEAIDCWKTKG